MENERRNMSKRIICFSLGLSQEDVEKGKASFYSLIENAPVLDVISISKTMLEVPVEKVLEKVFDDSGLNAAIGQRGSGEQVSEGLYKYRVVVMLAQEREQVLQVMRSFKAVLPDPQNIIFAVITETVLTWTFGDYIGHLGAEHEYVKKTQNGK